MDKKEDSSPKTNFARKEDNIIYVETERSSPYLCRDSQSPHELPLIKCADINSRVRPPELVMKLNITGLKDDYYLNLLDWNAQNSVAIALDASVCIWSTEHCRLMCEIHMNSNSKYASSIAWIKDGSCLAVGTSDGEVQLWDIETRKRLRNMCGHTSVVGALSWNNHILSSGSRLGFIHHYDVRMAHHHIGSLRHTKSISGLKWSPDGCRLASGSSDGILNIWPNDPNTTFRCRPLQSMVHPTAVKAMDWCPWQSEIVAVGGGMTDGVVRVWDINNGNCLRSTETKSQICSLLWLACSKEIVTGHGLPKNQIVRWDFHSLTRKAEIKGHKGRVLSLAQSPSGSHIFSAAADGTACMWKISGD
ncbi:cell division cycle protein 20 homolog B-like [Erpetoichthys calabaricus]|uniref:cell division cycle protein 20 homolog B-like n=1 Tax=Erpetoichthys calabaricus TaxID=27687 RepID=UPI002233E678|nr:cell division cycle protein 20 homolog B-like [Erpetoichthys calabaricus]